MSVTAKTRRDVYARDPECIVQGVTSAHGLCYGPRTLQHTVGKGMGGSKLFDTADLLVSMCNYHNVLLTSSAKFQAFGKARGWVRDRNSTRDPRMVPVLYADGWFRLEGSIRIPVFTPDALEYMTLIGQVTF